MFPSPSRSLTSSVPDSTPLRCTGPSRDHWNRLSYDPLRFSILPVISVVDSNLLWTSIFVPFLFSIIGLPQHLSSLQTKQKKNPGGPGQPSDPFGGPLPRLPSSSIPLSRNSSLFYVVSGLPGEDSLLPSPSTVGLSPECRHSVRGARRVLVSVPKSLSLVDLPFLFTRFAPCLESLDRDSCLRCRGSGPNDYRPLLYRRGVTSSDFFPVPDPVGYR